MAFEGAAGSYDVVLDYAGEGRLSVDGGRAACARIGEALRTPHLRARMARCPPAGTRSSSARDPGGRRRVRAVRVRDGPAPRVRRRRRSASSIRVVRPRGDADRRQTLRRCRRSRRDRGPLADYCSGGHRPADRGDRRARSGGRPACARSRGSRWAWRWRARSRTTIRRGPPSIARDAARSALRAAVAVDPDLARPWHDLAALALEDERPRDAIEAARAAARAAPALVGAAAAAGARVHGARAGLRRQRRGRRGGARGRVQRARVSRRYRAR